MSRTYTATGINLKGMPLGEVDRLVTILTPEYGLIRVVAPGARKYKSQLRGRSELFVVNQLLIAKGRSLDKITQAETIESYPKISKDLKKLAASQYLAEVVLCLAVSEQPQPELYELLNEHLRRIEQVNNNENIFAYITQGVFHLLAIAGLAPLVHSCCLTQKALFANFQEPKWQVSFSFELGGLVNLSLISEENNHHNQPVRVNAQLGAIELTLLQQLGTKSLPETRLFLPEELMEINLDNAWIKLERVLRNYAEYHCGQSLRCGALLDSFSKEQF